MTKTTSHCPKCTRELRKCICNRPSQATQPDWSSINPNWDKGNMGAGEIGLPIIELYDPQTTQETPFPQRSLFMFAGIGAAEMLEIQKRWPVLTEEERQQVVRRVVPLRDKSLEDLLL